MAYTEQSQEQAPKELPKVLVFDPPNVLSVYGKQLSEKFQLLQPSESPMPTHQFLATHAGSVQAMLCSGRNQVPTHVLSSLPSLRVIVTTSAGLNHINLPECRRRGISVANTGTVYSADVADTAVGLLIDVVRKITAGDRHVRGGLWPMKGEYLLGSKLGGKRVGIVGLGNIGLEVAKRLEAFGCTILYNSRKKKSSVPFPFYADISELAANSDILVICSALTDQTHHMINKEVLLALGEEGVIVNIGRGAVIDEKELVGCLVQGKIAGAGLDVFENEPEIPKELFALDNVVLSPHQGVYTEEAYLDLYELVLGNLEAFFSDKPLLSPVVDE